MSNCLLSKKFTLVTALVLFVTVETYKLENVALGKKAYQSSNIYPEEDHADKAVDGLYDSGVDTCSHTKAEANAFWEVDLGAKLYIDHVTVYRRIDCSRCDERSRDVELYIGLGVQNYKRFGYHEGITDGVYTFQLAKPVFGQWVRITRIPSVVEILDLCEVEVYGYEIETYFRIVHDQTGMKTFIQTSLISPTITHCGYTCFKTSGCEAANYDEDKHICDLFTSSSNEEAVRKSMLIPYK